MPPRSVKAYIELAVSGIFSFSPTKYFHEEIFSFLFGYDVCTPDRTFRLFYYINININYYFICIYVLIFY